MKSKQSTLRTRTGTLATLHSTAQCLALESRRLLALVGPYYPQTAIKTNGIASYKLEITADLNGDSIQDVVFGNSFEIFAAIGNGNRTFRPPIKLTDNQANAILAADLNGDSNDDLILVSGFSNNATLLLSNASGAFTPSTLNLGFQARTVVAGDFNGDGAIDLAAIAQFSFAGPNNALFFGHGDGSFATSTAISPDVVAPTGIRAADLNGDGITDLVVSNLAVNLSNTVVLRADTAGSFIAIQTLNTNLATFELVDATGDGRLDLVPSNSSSPVLKIYAGTASGFNESAISITIGSHVDLHFGDADGDSIPDLFTSESSSLWMRRGLGSGTFATASLVVTPTSSTLMFLVADLDNDHLVDFVFDNFGTLELYFSQGNGAAGLPVTSFGVQVQSIVSADFNGDGKDDLAGFATSSLGTVKLILRSATGNTYDAPINIQAGTINGRLFVADVNGDQRPDLVSEGLNDKILLNTGEGTFSSPIPWDGSFLSSYSIIEPGDFNGDGFEDLLVWDNGRGNIRLSNGDGTFTAAPTMTGSGRFGATSDFNADGVLDFALLSGDGVLSIRLGVGDGSLSEPISQSIPNLLLSPSSLLVGRFDMDDTIDLAIISGSNVLLLKGNGIGAFSSPIVSNFAGSLSGAIAADADDDGYEDIVVMPSQPVVLNASASGVFTSDVPITQSSSQLAIATDFNGDGRIDIVSQSLFGMPTGPRPVFENVGRALAPSLRRASFDVNTRNVRFRFDARIDPSSVNAGDLVVTPLTPGSGSFSSSTVTLADNGYTVEFKLPSSTPDGDYQFSIASGSLTSVDHLNVQTAAIVPADSSFILAGDVNRDRVVNSDDLLILIQNYGQTGKTFSQGNLNYSADGAVGFDDLLLLAQRYGKTLVVQAPFASAIASRRRGVNDLLV